MIKLIKKLFGCNKNIVDIPISDKDLTAQEARDMSTVLEIRNKNVMINIINLLNDNIRNAVNDNSKCISYRIWESNKKVVFKNKIVRNSIKAYYRKLGYKISYPWYSAHTINIEW